MCTCSVRFTSTQTGASKADSASKNTCCRPRQATPVHEHSFGPKTGTKIGIFASSTACMPFSTASSQLGSRVVAKTAPKAQAAADLSVQASDLPTGAVHVF
jgi:hypothetical protein